MIFEVDAPVDVQSKVSRPRKKTAIDHLSEGSSLSLSLSLSLSFSLSL